MLVDQMSGLLYLSKKIVTLVPGPECPVRFKTHLIQFVFGYKTSWAGTAAFVSDIGNQDSISQG